MLVGPTGCGKSTTWKILLSALSKLEAMKAEFYIIDPKAFPKDDLYGWLDSTTLEWSDGVFTHIIWKICENSKGELLKR